MGHANLANISVFFSKANEGKLLVSMPNDAQVICEECFHRALRLLAWQPANNHQTDLQDDIVE